MSAAEDPRPEREDALREAADEEPPPEDMPDDASGLDEVDVRDLLRGALQAPPAAPSNLLVGVQKRLRTRSRGKFYADGWSTTRSPRSLYLTTSVLMLVLIAFVFLVLIPWGGGALP